MVGDLKVHFLDVSDAFQTVSPVSAARGRAHGCGALQSSEGVQQTSGESFRWIEEPTNVLLSFERSVWPLI